MTATGFTGAPSLVTSKVGVKVVIGHSVMSSTGDEETMAGQDLPAVEMYVHSPSYKLDDDLPPG